MTLTPCSAPFWAAVTTGDDRAARRLVVEQLDQGVAGSALIVDVLAPAQREVGLRWQRAQCTVADEHVATAVVDACLALIESSAPRPEAGAPLLAVTCAESEWHTLAARMAAQLMRENGADVRFLGASIPADHLREHLARLRPDALVLSATVPTSLPGAARSIEAAHQVGVPVVAGGAAFGTDPTLATRLGAAGWLEDASALDPHTLPDCAWAPSPRLAWPEFLSLEHETPTVTAAAYDGLLRQVPALRLMTPAHAARTREDLESILKFLAVSVLVGEDRLMYDVTAWLVTVLASRGVPPSVVQASYHALADQLPSDPGNLLAVLADQCPGLPAS